MSIIGDRDGDGAFRPAHDVRREHFAILCRKWERFRRSLLLRKQLFKKPSVAVRELIQTVTEEACPFR
jgi:hypothetical protein